MAMSRRKSRLRIPPASLMLAGACLQACLFSWGGKEPGGVTKPQLFPGYYTFLFPTESSRLHLDSIYTVRWQASDSAGDGPVRMYMYRNDSLLGDFHSSLPATGSSDWNLAVTRFLGDHSLGADSGYRFRIVNLADTSRSAFGPRFTLYSDHSGSLELTSPAQGARVEDSILRIAWTVSGDVGDSVGLHLYLDSRMLTTLSKAVSAAAGEFFWTADLETMPTGDTYRIHIFALSNPAIGHMGPAFSIATPVRSGTYEFIRPRDGDVWTAGELVEIEWKVTGDPGTFTGLTLWRDAPREFIREWTPIGTFNAVQELRVPTDLADGSYRLRAASRVDSSLQAFSPAFFIQGGEPLPE